MNVEKARQPRLLDLFACEGGATGRQLLSLIPSVEEGK